jgi:hypothetical protein
MGVEFIIRVDVSKLSPFPSNLQAGQVPASESQLQPQYMWTDLKPSLIGSFD